MRYLLHLAIFTSFFHSFTIPVNAEATNLNSNFQAVVQKIQKNKVSLQESMKLIHLFVRKLKQRQYAQMEQIFLFAKSLYLKKKKEINNNSLKSKMKTQLSDYAYRVAKYKVGEYVKNMSLDLTKTNSGKTKNYGLIPFSKERKVIGKWLRGWLPIPVYLSESVTLGKSKYKCLCDVLFVYGQSSLLIHLFELPPSMFDFDKQSRIVKYIIPLYKDVLRRYPSYLQGVPRKSLCDKRLTALIQTTSQRFQKLQQLVRAQSSRKSK